MATPPHAGTVRLPVLVERAALWPVDQWSGQAGSGSRQQVSGYSWSESAHSGVSQSLQLTSSPDPCSLRGQDIWSWVCFFSWVVLTQVSILLYFIIHIHACVCVCMYIFFYLHNLFHNRKGHHGKWKVDVGCRLTFTLWLNKYHPFF